MPPEFRYSLTRICLRTGQLSLSPRLAEVFPSTGSVRALDTLDDVEFELSVSEPRKVSGLGAFLERHGLEVNDEIQVRPREDGLVALTAMPRANRRSLPEGELTELLDTVAEEGPLTEEEIRALYPQIPADYPLAAALAAHPRLRLRGGRWVGGASELADARTQAAEAADSGPAGEGYDGLASEVEAPEPAGAGDHTRDETAASGSEQQPNALRHDFADERSEEPPVPPERQGEFRPGRGEEQRAESFETREPRRATRQGRSERWGPEQQGKSGPSTDSSGEPEQRRARNRDRGQPGRPAAVTPYPRGVLFPGEAALNSQRPAGDLRLVNRAREALTGFGYRVEGLPHGMLLARADLGRRKHTVLVRVLADGERLDWAALLARRRERTADYLAVFGDHRDLHRLTAPAELARATLWSWDGIARVQNLSRTVLIGPFDLEPHFAKDGMFGNGLRQFERSLGRMIGEKGTLSAVISRLGALRAPAVFVLDDLVEGELQREEVAKALELLARAPFHLVARIDRGEYCLRHSVSDSLAHLAEYARSLGERLPGAGDSRSALVAASGDDSRQERWGEFQLAEDD